MKRILVVKPSSFGDIVNVFPALEVLKAAYPEAKMDFLVNPEFADLLDYSPWRVEKKIIFERKKLGSWKSFIPAYFRLRQELRREEYDCVIDFQGLFRSAELATTARSKLVYGFAKPRELGAMVFYTRRVETDMNDHAVRRNLALAMAVVGESVPMPKLNLPILDGEKCDISGEIVSLVVGARWQSKMFPPELFAKVAELISAEKPEVTFVAVGGGNDRAQAEQVAKLLPKSVKFRDLTGQTSCAELAGVLRKSAAVLSCDSGPMHFAAALGVPVVALFGPTKPELTGPFGEKCRVFRSENLDCLGCMRRTCPKQNYECFDVSQEKVAATILEILK